MLCARVRSKRACGAGGGERGACVCRAEAAERGRGPTNTLLPPPKGSNETGDFVMDLQGGEFSFNDCKIGGNNFGKVHDGFCGYYKVRCVLRVV